ncbi:NACHT domain-containing protein [Schinkia azotoformans]|uniref:NACHT domain-containing protein n=1 Tax=Schinkia azotoformans TaxID=1454 RepID=UPI002DB6F02A|nr:NACHT domain-containing protein [Schinkia azotoformans]MEC1718413.1 NACHT domain-containing protein [Schinkia azotoformans]MEC1756228.1 NACHT domain-containing protein [Schinkia azotoformans]
MDQFQIDINKIATNLIEKNIEKVTKGIYDFSSAKRKDLLLKSKNAFDLYLSSAIDKYSSTKTILYRDQRVPLYKFYVDVNLRYQFETINTDNINNLLELSNNITIFGSGGMGKSTLLKHLFLNTILNTDLIPLFVELRDLNDAEITLIDCIYKSLSNLKFNLEKEYFVKALHNGCFVIFLDGFDEVNEEKRRKLTMEIDLMVDKYSENYYIVSSRPGDFLYRGWNKFIDLHVIPLDKQSALSLIEKMDYDNDIKEKFLLELNDNLYKKHQSFCSNPLLLNIMLLTYHEFAEIPDKVHIFYGRAFDALYSQHDATKAGFKRKLMTIENLAIDDFKRVLSAISALSYMEKTYSFDQDQLFYYINSAKQIVDIEFDSNRFKTDLIESVCILVIDGLKYKYQHRSFQEYFTARFISNLPDEEQTSLLLHIIEEEGESIKFDEVFNLLFEMANEKFERNLIIPALEKLKEIIKDSSLELSYLKYMETSFDEFFFDPALLVQEKLSKEAEAIAYSYKENKSGFIDFVQFIYNKYCDLLDIKLPKLETIIEPDNIDSLHEFGEDDEYSQSTRVPLNKVTCDEQLFNDFIGFSKFYLQRLEYSFLVLDQRKPEL